MSGEFIVITILGLITLFAFILTFYFYIQQKKSNYLSQKKKHAAALSEDLTQGRYFKRAVPESLADQYKPKEINFENAENETRRVFKRVYITFALAALIIMAIAIQARIEKSSFIDLTQQEIDAVVATKHIWEIEQTDNSLAEKYFAELRKHHVYLVLNRMDLTTPFSLAKRNLTTYAITQWRDWLTAKQISSSSCYWENLKRCQSSQPNALFIVLPGQWDANGLDWLESTGSSVFLFGPPRQVYDNKLFKWKDLRFEHHEQTTTSSIALVGERPLTIDWDAGHVVPFPPIDTNYRVLSKTFDGLSINYPFYLDGDFETRLYSLASSNSRFVWSDFSPRQEHKDNKHILVDRLLGSIFRFLLKKEYQTLAMWPHGKQMVGFVAMDVEHNYDAAEEVSDKFRANKAPLTHFVLTDVAQQHKKALKHLAKNQSVECFGDIYEKFSDTSGKLQSQRLARCRKVIKALLGEEPKGFRAPAEEYDRSTFDAMTNNRYRYIFGGTSTDRAVPRYFVSKETGRRVLEFGRMVSDDFNLIKEGRSSSSAARAIVVNQIEWTRALHGMYGFSLHSQLADKEIIQDVIDTLLIKFKEKDIHFSTISEIAQWWEVRFRLINNLPVRPTEINKYRPHKLQLLESGQVIKQEVTLETQTSN